MTCETEQDIWPDMSSMAQYCEDETDFLELCDVILNEIDRGATAIGIFGSSAKFKNAPNSDIDLIIINPKVLPTIFHSPTFRVGREKTSNKNRNERWIELITLNPAYIINYRRSKISRNILRSTDWKWSSDERHIREVMNGIDHPSTIRQIFNWAKSLL